ncbi:hypothetical protein Sjap_014798 [Stephania japonica]|uniref:Uncharacterized protein n=1 Tax=Stephania japonica TaxID=461633 RepID=A0AAP0IHY8_9MAGN
MLINELPFLVAFEPIWIPKRSPEVFENFLQSFVSQTDLDTKGAKDPRRHVKRALRHPTALDSVIDTVKNNSPQRHIKRDPGPRAALDVVTRCEALGSTATLAA